MGLKDEVNAVEEILKMPKVHMDMEACKSIGGSDKTAPNTQISRVEEITQEDIKKIPTRMKLNEQERRQFKMEADTASEIAGIKTAKRTVEVSDDMSFEEAVEKMFECVNVIDEKIGTVSESSGRLGDRLTEHFEVLKKRLRKFEIYYDRTMQKLQG